MVPCDPNHVGREYTTFSLALDVVLRFDVIPRMHQIDV